jgi:hypothetical protein
MNEKVVKTLEKIGTVLVDRRFWVAVLAIILTLGGAFGFSEDQLRQIGDAFGDDGEGIASFFEQVIKVIVTIIAAVKVISSWTERPPSGLDHKDFLLASRIEDRYGK